jgi:hypothetical protein
MDISDISQDALPPLVVEKVPLDYVLSHKENFNVCNLFEGAAAPDDYTSFCARYTVPHWLPGVVPPRRFAWVVLTHCGWLKTASLLCSKTGQYENVFRDHMHALMVRHGPAVDALLSQGLTFVRGSRCSCKYGTSDLRPFSSAAQVFDALIRAPRFHTPVKDVSGENTLALWFFPWVDILVEYRVFVHCRRVTAISQQVWYSPYKGPDLGANLDLVARMCKAAEATTAGADLDSAVADVALLHDGSVYVIELNPFGQQYPSGSALFHWKTDTGILCAEDTDTDASVVFRFTAT